MAEMEGLLVGDDVRAVEMSLDYTEAVYMLACLGASNSTLFTSLNGAGRSLFDELSQALGIRHSAGGDVNEATRLFREISDVLDVWQGRRNYTKARQRAIELGL